LASVPEDAELGQAEDDSEQLLALCSPCHCNFCKGMKSMPFMNDLPCTVERQVYAACLGLFSRGHTKNAEHAHACVFAVGDTSVIHAATAELCGVGLIEITSQDSSSTVLQSSSHYEIFRDVVQGHGICAVDGIGGYLCCFNSPVSSSCQALDMDSYCDGRSKLARGLAEKCNCVVMLSSNDSNAVIVFRGRRGEVHRHNYMPMQEQASAGQKICIIA
jgi:hypothetical protein